MIHVCFAIYDKVGSYSRFTGTAMVSLFENTKSRITVHVLHDNTLTNDNSEKFIQIANRYDQQLKFYNVEELCADKFAKVEEYFPQAKESHFSIAMFYRLFIPHLLLPQGIEKAIYLDSDIIINLDIEEFWQIELGDKPFGAITRSSQFKDEETAQTGKVIPLVREGFVNAEDYFHSGLLLMNLKVMGKEEDTILAGMKFVGESPHFIYPDQDVLNYCFSTSFLKLPVKFNRVISFARSEDEWTIEKKIYHYAANRIHFGMDLSDPYNRLFMDYFIKTPWFDAETTAALSGISLPSRKNYSVSVVIPLYNAEEFIGECLESLLIQTFQDFEVIVVDDCSTDNSVEIVESYLPKFNGRLTLTKTEKNSGGGGYVPRNIGMMLARGEYIQFLDADDMLLGTALEALYMAAILHNAEIVYTSSYYRLNAPNDVYLYKDGTSKNKKMNNIQTDLTIDNPTTNLNRLLLESGEGNFRSCWTKFVRRDFLIKNRIFFPHHLSNAGDAIWVIKLYCHARRFLRIATPFYLYRLYNTGSVVRTVRETQDQCRYWFSTFVDFAKSLHELNKENEVLAGNPLYSLRALKGHFSWCLNRTEKVRKELDYEEIYKALYKNSDDSLALLLPFLFSFIDNEKKIIDNEKKINAYYIEPINKFKIYFTAKIFVRINKKMDKDTIQILSVSDDKAKLTKPEWWQRNGTCHIIDSYVGNLEIVAKAITEGNVQIRLGGAYVPNPEDKSKRLPYWIDYTKLIVNGKTIFDKVTSAWHDKNYIYSLNVKANEEIKIHIEWLPHRADIIEPKVVTPPPKPEPKDETVSTKVTVPESKVIVLQPPKVESSIPRRFNPRITARIDAKFMSTTGEFQILSTSDKKASVSKPNWFQHNGTGYVIQSSNGELTFVAKATADGKINLNLRGMDVRNSEDWSNGIAKRIPYWIDYTKLTVNGKNIFNTRTPAWCDKPYACTVEAKANEEVKIQIEWQPNKSDPQ